VIHPTQQVQHWNWGGIAFVAGVFLMVALTGWITELLRRWGESPEPEKTEPRGIKLNPDFAALLRSRMHVMEMVSERMLPSLPPERQFIPAPPRMVTFSSVELEVGPSPAEFEAMKTLRASR
jgi:hypothetical protein